mgnify:CR=1 FL=1
MTAKGGSGAAKCSNCCAGGSGGANGRVVFAATEVQGSATPAAKVLPKPQDGGGKGSWASQILDSELPTAQVVAVTWTATVPETTGLVIEARSAKTPFASGDAKPDWYFIAKSGATDAALGGRYIQLRAGLTSPTPGVTPALAAISVTAVNETTIGGLPLGLTLKLDGADVQVKTADPVKSGIQVVEQLDVTDAFNGASAADGIAELQIGSTTPGRYQWLVWVER